MYSNDFIQHIVYVLRTFRAKKEEGTGEWRKLHN